MIGQLFNASTLRANDLAAGQKALLRAAEAVALDVEVGLLKASARSQAVTEFLMALWMAPAELLMAPVVF
jgi:hypothetical protein